MYGYGNSMFLATHGILARSGPTGPINTVAPAITGTAVDEYILSCSTGTWTGTGSITYAYQWTRNGSNIGSATNSTYTLVTADVGQSILCVVTATDITGSASANSNTVTPISNAQYFINQAGITDPTQQSAINTLVTDLKGYNIWTKFKAIYPIVGGTASSHKFNLKDPRDLDAAFRLNYAIGVTHSANGMVSNGSSGYADTFLQPATHLSNNSCHISYYSRTNQSDNNWDCGAGDDANSYLAMNIRTAAGAFRPFAQDISINTFSNSNSTGFYVANRTASNVKNGWKNGSKVVTSTAVSSNRTNIKVFLLALNYGTPSFYSTRQCAFASIGDGLSDTEAANLYTAVQAFQVTLGRSIGTQTVSDADAQAFVTAANITDQVEANAINNLVIGMKADGLWTKMKAIYPVVGGVASSHAVNLKTPGTFNLTFASGWTHSSTGMTPNGTSAYANTGFNPLTQSLPRNSAGMGVYNRTNTLTTGAHGQRVSNTFEIFERWTNNVAYCYINDNSGGFQVVNLNSTGFFQGSRTASNAIRLNINTTQNTGIQASTGDSNGNLWIGASNNGASGTFFNNREIAFFYIGEGFDNTEMQNIYTRVQTFQTTLNRNV